MPSDREKEGNMRWNVMFDDEAEGEPWRLGRLRVCRTKPLKGQTTKCRLFKRTLINFQMTHELRTLAEQELRYQ
jgi:hypothetical protein